MKTVAALVVVALLMIPGVALASSATDAALGLGAFAVFNQIISGTGIFGGLAPQPVYAAPQPVYVAPPQPVYVPAPPVYVAPRPVYVAPPPVYVRPAPVYTYPAPPHVYHRAHGHAWGHYHR
jgi:PXPV repeat (3 copies)